MILADALGHVRELIENPRRAPPAVDVGHPDTRPARRGNSLARRTGEAFHSGQAGHCDECIGHLSQFAAGRLRLLETALDLEDVGLGEPGLSVVRLLEQRAIEQRQSLVKASAGIEARWRENQDPGIGARDSRSHGASVACA